MRAATDRLRSRFMRMHLMRELCDRLIPIRRSDRTFACGKRDSESFGSIPDSVLTSRLGYQTLANAWIHVVAIFSSALLQITCNAPVWTSAGMIY